MRTVSFQSFNLVSGKKHGSQHVIITLVDKVTKAVDFGDIVINMFIDLRKAFDKDSHSILLKTFMHTVLEVIC